jgi:hypothetical protein
MHRDVVREFELVTGASVDAIARDIDHPLFSTFHTLREEQAANLIKDYALGALPTIGTDKPTYAYIDGPAHVSEKMSLLPNMSKGIAMAFARLGLNVHTQVLPEAWSEDKIVEWYHQQNETRIVRHMAPLVAKLAELAVDDNDAI